MFKRILFFAYGSLSYLIFLGTFLYAVCFIGAFGVPRTLEGVIWSVEEPVPTNILSESRRNL